MVSLFFLILISDQIASQYYKKNTRCEAGIFYISKYINSALLA